MKKIIYSFTGLFFLTAILFAQTVIQETNSPSEAESKTITIGNVVMGMMALTIATAIVFTIYVFITYRKSNLTNSNNIKSDENNNLSD